VLYDTGNNSSDGKANRGVTAGWRDSYFGSRSERAWEKGLRDLRSFFSVTAIATAAQADTDGAPYEQIPSSGGYRMPRDCQSPAYMRLESINSHGEALVNSTKSPTHKNTDTIDPVT
jgi:hypothetical protein